jgi:hypothetical protein
MKLECYLTRDIRYDIRPASNRRQWMDETHQAFAYRCMPLSIANSHGWEICCSHGFEAEWTGGPEPGDVRVYPDGGAAIEVSGHFGSGIITFQSHFVIKTEPGYSLWVMGPPNHFKDGIQALSAAVETDWMPFSFTMNWKFTRAEHRIRFSQGEPYCFFFPVKTAEVEKFTPQMKRIDEAPELKEQFNLAMRKRTFTDQVKNLKERGYIKSPVEHSDLRPMLFQGWYSKGEFPDGSPWPEHRKKIRLKPFEAAKVEKEDAT